MAEENKTIMNSLIDAVGSGASALGGAVKAVTPTEPIFPTQKGTLRTADPEKPYEALFYPTYEEAYKESLASEGMKQYEEIDKELNPPASTMLPPSMPSTLDDEQKEVASALMSMGGIDQNTMNRSAQIAKKLDVPIHNVLMDVPSYAELYKEQERQRTVLGDAPLGRFIRNNLDKLPAVKDQLAEVKQAQTWYGRLALGIREPFRELAETNINAERAINGQEPYVRNEDPVLKGEKSGFWYGVGYYPTMIANTLSGAGDEIAVGGAVGGAGGGAGGAALAFQAGVPAAVPVTAFLGAAGGTVIGAVGSLMHAFGKDTVQSNRAQTYSRVFQAALQRGKDKNDAIQMAQKAALDPVSEATNYVLGAASAYPYGGGALGRSAFVTPAFTDMFRRAAIHTMVDVGIGATTEGLIQESAERSIQSGLEEGGIKLSAREVEENNKNVIEAIKAGGVLGLAMGGTLNFGGAYLDYKAQMKDAMEVSSHVENLIKSTEQIEATAMNPEVIEAALDAVTEGDNPNLYINREEILKLYQSENITPQKGDGFLGEVFDDPAKALREAEGTGFVEIPAHQFVPKLGSKAASYQLLAHMKADPMKLTPAELEKIMQTEIDPEVKIDLFQLVKKAQDGSSKPFLTVYRDIYKKLRVKYDHTSSMYIGRIMASNYEQRARDLSTEDKPVDAIQVYEQYPFVINNLDPEYVQKVTTEQNKAQLRSDASIAKSKLKDQVKDIKAGYDTDVGKIKEKVIGKLSSDLNLDVDGVFKEENIPSFVEQEIRSSPEFKALEKTRKQFSKQVKIGIDEYRNKRREMVVSPIVETRRERTKTAQKNQFIIDEKRPKSTVGGQTLGSSQVKVRGQYLDTTLKIVDADSLTPTIKDTESQLRDRDSAASEIQINDIASKLDPNDLLDTNSLDTGAPTLSYDGQIVGGNGRTFGIKRAYDMGTADAYSKAIKKIATKNKISLRGVKKPVLVRVFKDNLDITRVAEASNEANKLTMTAVENAHLDSQKITSFDAFDFADSGQVKVGSNVEAFQSFIGQLTPNEQGLFLTKEGELSREGARRIENAFVYKAYGKGGILSGLLEQIPEEQKNMYNAFLKASPDVAKIADAIEKGKLGEYGFSQPLNDAFSLFRDFKNQNTLTLEQFLGEDLFGGKKNVTPESRLFLDFLNENAKSSKALTEGLRTLSREIQRIGDPNATSLIDEGRPERLNLLTDALRLKQDDFLYSDRGQILLEELGSTIDLFQGADETTILHEHAHKELFTLARDADKSERLGEIYTDIGKWVYQNFDEIMTNELGRNNRLKDKDLQAVNEELLKEIKARGADYLQSLFDKRLRIDSDLDRMGVTIIQENYARGFEAYLFEGKAPSTLLKKAFEYLKQKFVELYKTIKALEVPIDDTLRSVFDRLLASDEMIEEARNNTSNSFEFGSAEEAGMTPAEYKMYRDLLGETVGEAKQSMMKTITARLHAEKNKDNSEILKDIKDRLRDDEYSRSEIKVLRDLMGYEGNDSRPTQSPLKFSKEAIDAIMGDDFHKMMPKELIGEEDLASSYLFVELDRRKIDPKTWFTQIADLENYRKQLVQNALDKGNKTTEFSLQTTISKRLEVQAREMLKSQGIKKTADDLRAEAEALVRSKGMDEVMMMELNALAKRVAEETNSPHKPMTLPEMDYWVTQTFKDMNAQTAYAGIKKFLQAERQANDKFIRALSKKDIPSAFAARRQQLLSRLMHKKAVEFKKTADANSKLISRIKGKKEIKSISPDHLALLHKILQTKDIQTALSTKDPEKRLSDIDVRYSGSIEEAIRQFVGVEAEAMGETSLLSLSSGEAMIEHRSLINFDGVLTNKTPSEMSVTEFDEWHASLKSIYDNGREERVITVDGKEEAVDALINEITEGMDKKPPIEQGIINDAQDAGHFEKVKRAMGAFVRYFNATLITTEHVGKRIDDWKVFGRFGDLLEDIRRAHYKTDERVRRIQDSERQFLRNLDGKARKAFFKQLDAPIKNDVLMADEGSGLKPMRFTKRRALEMAKHLGTESNLQTLLNSYGGDKMGWTRDNVYKVLFQNGALTKTDMDYLSVIWKSYSRDWPDYQRMLRKFGAVPETLVPAEIETPWGKYQGGYYPVRRINDDVVPDIESDPRTVSLLGGARANATRASGSRSRTNAGMEAGHVDLTLGIGFYSHKRNLHDIDMREPLNNYLRVIKDERFKKSFKRAFGREYYQNLQNHGIQASSKNIIPPVWTPIKRFMDYTATGFVVAEIGFSLTTLAKHSSGAMALLPSHRDIGVLDFTSRMSRAIGGEYFKMRDEAIEKFGEVAVGAGKIDYALHSDSTGIGDTQMRRHIKAFEHLSHVWIAKTDQFTRVIAAWAAYDKFKRENPLASEADAVRMANYAVRETHAAVNALGASPVQTNPIFKPFVMFYAFFNRFYNRFIENMTRSRDSVRKYKAGEQEGWASFAEVWHEMSSAFMLAGVVGVIESYVAGHHHWDEDDDLLTASTKQVAMTAFGQLMASVPVVRTIMSGMTYDDYTPTPMFAAVENVGKLSKDIKALFSGETPDKMDIHLAELIGVAAHIPAKPYNAARYTLNVMMGSDDLPDDENIFNYILNTIRNAQRGYKIDPSKLH